ncbi:MAG: cell division protein FtsA [Deltaproteobacteria bacterium]|jgi:cell division protein FtsA|nr:cell division protein FtsA [Deltaproteobacteria bacterium]
MTDQERDRLVGLDIGTTKVTCVAAVVNDFGALEIIGVGNAASLGMTRGAVTNMEAAKASIAKAVDECRRMAGCRIDDVYVGIAGGHIASFNSHGVVAVLDKTEKLVTEEDKRRAVEAAETLNIPQGRIIVQSIPQEYKVDDVEGILDPLNMVGVRLEVNVHVITSALNAYQNIVNCVSDADLNMKEMILESLASAEAVLTSQEMDVGAAVLDIGGGTTDVAILLGGAVKYSGVVPMGGDNLTQDLALGLRTSVETAERFKVARGACRPDLLSQEALVIPSLGGVPTEVDPAHFCSILEGRMTDVLECVNMEFVKSGLDADVHEVVLTGGTSLLPGVADLARRVLNRSVRLGEPGIDGGLSSMVNDPRYSTAIGLIMYGLKCDKEPRGPGGPSGHEGGALPGRLWRSIRRFFAGD